MGDAAGNGRAAAIEGERFVLMREDDRFPQALAGLRDSPEKLYVIGDPSALEEGLSVVGARKATPYGLNCARHFANMAAQRGIVIISGGARGCDAAAHEGALDAAGRTVVFLGGGCDRLYPASHVGLFQRVIELGGAIVSEQSWEMDPRPWMFRARNRLIAGLAKATLIVEAGLPSGTFSTADEALNAGREVLAVPGSIVSATSRGANRLIYQGATPVVDDEGFSDILFGVFGCLKQDTAAGEEGKDADMKDNEVVRALRAAPMSIEELYLLAQKHCGKLQPRDWLMPLLAEGMASGTIARYPDGRWGPPGT